MNLIYQLSEILERLETREKPFDKKEMENLETTLLMVRKSLMDLQKQNEFLEDQTNFTVNKTKNYIDKLEKEIYVLKGGKKNV